MPHFNGEYINWLTVRITCAISGLVRGQKTQESLESEPIMHLLNGLEGKK